MRFVPEIAYNSTSFLSITSSGAITYSELMNSIGAFGYRIKKMQITSIGMAQVSLPIQYSRIEADGNQFQKPIVPNTSPYQYQPSVKLDMKHMNVILDGNAYLLFTILGNERIQLILTVTEYTFALKGLRSDDVILSFYIKNNTDQIIVMPLLGGGLTNIQSNVNATTSYRYNISDALLSDSAISIQAKQIGNADFVTYSVGNVSSFSELQAALTAMGFGTWFLTTEGGSTFLNIYNDQLEFGDLSMAFATQYSTLAITAPLVITPGDNVQEISLEVVSGSLLVEGTQSLHGMDSGSLVLLPGQTLTLSSNGQNYPLEVSLTPTGVTNAIITR